MNNSVFIIIPAFNEADVIGEVIKELLPLGYAIVVVDDGSSDNTRQVVQALPVYYLRHRINFGQGAAIQTGISFALKKGADIFVTFDADGQHNPADIAPMIDKLVSGQLDMVFGSRFLPPVTTQMSFSRKAILGFARYLNFLLTGILLSDAHNGLRVFNRKAASSIHILENGMAHATELLILVKKHGLSYGEAPVQVNYTPYSKGKGQKNSHSFKVLQDILLYKIFK